MVNTNNTFRYFLLSSGCFISCNMFMMFKNKHGLSCSDVVYYLISSSSGFSLVTASRFLSEWSTSDFLFVVCLVSIMKRWIKSEVPSRRGLKREAISLLKEKSVIKSRGEQSSEDLLIGLNREIKYPIISIQRNRCEIRLRRV